MSRNSAKTKKSKSNSDSVNELMNKVTMVDLMGREKHQDVSKIFGQVTPSREFEAMFFNINPNSHMSMEQFLKCLEYMRALHRLSKGKMELTSTQSLDLSYNPDIEDDKKLVSYRVSINGIDQINRYRRMFFMRKNHVIYTGLISKIKENEPQLSILKKSKKIENMVDVPELDIRFRLSDEEKVSAMELDDIMKLDETTRNRISFRYKDRVSLVLSDTDNYRIVIDLTNVKSHRNINLLEEANSRYELEIEVVLKKGKIDTKQLDEVYNETHRILKVLQGSSFVITRTKTEKVLHTYSNLLELAKLTHSLHGRQPHSLEIQHVTDVIPNKYAVTDKADGERYFLVITDDEVFLISNTLEVKATGIMANGYSNTILDGELIFLPKNNRYMYLIFDCLFLAGEDVRGIPTLMTRLLKADQIINDRFILKGQQGFKWKEYTGKYDSKKMIAFHKQEMKKMMDSWNHDIDHEKQYPLIRRKYFISVLGAQPNEIFKYSEVMWESYTTNPEINCPYVLDGLIYQPLEQEYIVSSKESKFHDYKWKPDDKNSIDFYITFARDEVDQKILTMYDNSRDEEIKGRPYRICYLHVGRMTKSGEQPVLFQKDTNKSMSYLFLDRGEIRDLDGKILQDNTVVEFYYNNDPNINEKFRWIPIRTRYDKTETMLYFKRKYGNFHDVANRVWRSIANPILMKDFSILANDDLYHGYVDKMRGKIDHSLILSEQKENMYYQEKKDLAFPMRNFHNFIKSNIIYTYCNPDYHQGEKQVVLDFGCGKGGDLAKFHYSRVGEYVGFDTDNAGLIAATDGALSRYKLFRKKYTNFPRMHFIHADGRARLDYESQLKKLGTMSPMNRQLLEKFFSSDKPTQFDVINCQFVFHYLLSDKTVWDNVTYNLKTFLKPGGYFLVTSFDAQKVVEKLKESDRFASYYTDKKGKKKMMFEIIRQFQETDLPEYGLGYAIDVHNDIYMQDDKYVTEYLVDPKFITRELEQKCDMELVETGLFETIYYVNESYFKEIVPYEEYDKTRKFLINAGEFYNQKDEVNKACYEMTRLNRYYVFRRKETGKVKNTKKSDIKHKSGKKQKGGFLESTQLEGIDMSDMMDDNGIVSSSDTFIATPKEIGESLDRLSYLLEDGFYRESVADTTGNSFTSSVLHSLQRENIVPHEITPDEFCLDMGLQIPHDTKLTETNIKSLCNLKISHKQGKKSINALNGLNIFVLKDDCDDDVEVSLHSKTKKFNKNSKSIILSYDGTNYRSVYSGDRSVFDNDHPTIKKLLEQV